MRALTLAICLAALLVLPASATAVVTAGGTGWVWANPLPQGGDLDTVAFAGARGVAAGAGGILLRTEDAGANWAAVASGTETPLTEVAMPDANTVFAGGGCVLRRSTDGGTTFQRAAFAGRESSCSSPLAQLSFPTASVGYLILADGTVLRTANGGRSFVRRASLGIGSSLPQGGAADAVFTSDNTGVVSTGLTDPAFLRTEDGGQTWTRITPVNGVGIATVNRVRSMHFLSPTLGYAVSNGGPAPMAKTEDGGQTWTPLPLAGATGAPRAISCADANACVIVGGQAPDGPGDLVTWTADGGQTATTLPPSVGLNDIAFSSATRVVAVGDGGATLVSDDAGRGFARVGGALAGEFTGLAWAGGGTLFAFPRDGALARSTNGGFAWQALGVPPLGRAIDVSFVDDSIGYMLAAGGALQRTDDGGASWGVLAGQAAGGRALLATGPDALLVATSRGIVRSTDAGSTFARAAGATRPLRGFDRAGETLIAYGPRWLLASGDGGARWRALGRPPGGFILSADFVSARVGYVVRHDGEVVATTNGGRSWRLLTGVGRDDITQVSFGDARHGFLLLGAKSRLGGVLRTSDGGRSWRPQVLGRRPLAEVLALGSEGGVTLTKGMGQLFATAIGGDLGARSTLSLRLVSTRRAGRRTLVTVAGRLRPAPAGAGVSVTARIGGRWVRKFARVTARGRFRTTWRLRRDTVFVAQWRGAAGVRADGTAPLRVRVGGGSHR